MNNMEIFEEARTYLLSFDVVTKRILNKHLTFPVSRKPKNIPELYLALITHATNRQGLANYIGKIDRLSKVLFNFNPQEVCNTYTQWGMIFDIVQEKVNPPGKMEKNNNHNSWVIFSKTILSAAIYANRFSSIRAFYKYIEQFISQSADTRIALPLLLKEEIDGFGFALACDFLKENISPLFVKPDTHIRDIFIGIGKSAVDASDFEVFRDVIEFSESINKSPYEVDKLFWLVGSGNFYYDDMIIKSDKWKYIEMITCD